MRLVLKDDTFPDFSGFPDFRTYFLDFRIFMNLSDLQKGLGESPFVCVSWLNYMFFLEVRSDAQKLCCFPLHVCFVEEFF